MSGIEEIPAGYQGLRTRQEAFYEDLHQHPDCPITGTTPPAPEVMPPDSADLTRAEVWCGDAGTGFSVGTRRPMPW